MRCRALLSTGWVYRDANNNANSANWRIKLSDCVCHGLFLISRPELYTLYNTLYVLCVQCVV